MTRATASQRTLALTAGLALLSAGLAAGAPVGPLLRHWLPVGPLGLVAALTVLFLLADLCLLHVEVRREAYSVTLAGIPLAAGVLLCDSRELVAARVLGAAAAFAWQRPTALKACYNLAAYAFEAALDLAVLHLLVRPDTALTVELAVVCGLV